MNFKTVSIDGSSQDGVFVWWEPGRMRVEDLRDALTQAGCPGLLPKSSTVPAALRETLAGFIESAGVKQRGSPIDINPLREDVRGFEAVKQERGDTENDHEHIISVVLDGGGMVKIAKHNEAMLPQVDIIKDQLEAKMTEVFQQQLDYFPTAMVSSCLARVIEHLGGVLCRKAGGVYFLPESGAQKFEPLAAAIDSSNGVSIVITKFALKPGERSYKLVLTSIRKEISDALVEIEEGLSELGSKPRANGQATRLNTLDSLKAKVTQYEELLGVTMKDMHDAVEKVKAAVSARNVMDMCV